MTPFYELIPDDGEPFSAEAEPGLSDEQEQALALGRWHPDRAIVFRRNSYKRKPRDLVPGGSPALRLISSQVVAALRAADCTGWTTWPAQLLTESGKPLGDHTGLAVTGRCGPVQRERSERLGDKWLRGVFFDEGSWDGSDVFHPEGERAGWLLVSERAREALLSAGLVGIGFEPLSEVEYYD
jgi:hypothetical protein